jgi:Domain of unknown function (DUF4328)
LEIKPLAGLTKTLLTLLKLDLVLTVIALVVGFYDYHSYSNLSPDIDPNETILTSDAVSGIVGILQIILFIMVGIVFLRWIYLTNKNLHILSRQDMEFTPRWSVGWYFIPIANLFKPYQSMKEIWRVSHKNKSSSYTIVGWWWCLWIISAVLGRIAFRLTMRAETAEDYTISTAVDLASTGVNIILIILALMLVTRIGTAYSQSFVEQSAANDNIAREKV